MLNNNLNVEIQNKDGLLVVSSQVIARELNKRHQHICNKIEEVLEISQNFGLSKITPKLATSFEAVKSNYKDSMNRTQTEYLLSKDGFTLLVMNYTGYNDFKRAYIKKFNEMEQQLKTQQSSIADKNLYNDLVKMLSNKECFLTFDDLITISHKRDVREVCRFLTVKSLSECGNISNLLNTLQNQQELLRLQ